VDSNFPIALPHALYADHVLYHAYHFGSSTPAIRAWEFNGWRAESMSWKEGCYIHAGLSRTGPISIKGPEAKKYMQSIVINSLAKFPVGSMKHCVMINEAGLIAAHGIVQRMAEDEFQAFAGGPPGPAGATDVPFDCTLERRDDYLFQIAGPTALQVLEKATGENLRDVRFLRFRNTQVNGIKTEIGRIGMSGNLAYELHGPLADGPAIYQAVLDAGKDLGIERLGWGTYLVNHVEGGFPQITWTFVPAVDPAWWPAMSAMWQISGSVDPKEMRPRTRTPVEVRWHNMAKFDHDFVGSQALAAEMANPKRTTVTLRWNADDLIDMYSSLFRTGETYKPLDLPYAPQRWPMAHADHILSGGRPVGYSSGTAYSYYFREVISMGCVDLNVSDIGTEVVVQWGDHGGRIKNVRATVDRFPYLITGRNSDVDVTAMS
jgi:glycine cleavage system aminomethyltransferase T